MLTNRLWACASAGLLAASLAGCGNRPQPVTMAPPVSGSPVSSTGAAAGGASGVYGWQDVPANQQVPINRAVFDQGGYQLYAASGETIVVPFQNQNLYVMRFGRSTSGQTYFVNESGTPTLYLRQGDYLSNAAANDARWFPIPNDFTYSRPIYVSVAPSWSDYMALGWYPGMTYYGGMWGYSPGVHFVWMPSFYVGLGGTRYTSWNSYRTYYTSHPGYVRTRAVFNYSSPRGAGSFGSARSAGSTGSFGRGSRTAGSFGSARSSAPGTTGFGRPSGGGGSFGTGRSFSGSSASSSPAGASSFGSRRPSGSFGGSSGGFGASSRPSVGSSFGSRPSGGSFGGSSASRPSFGGSTRSSFGGSRPSGGSFGRRR